MTREVTRNRPTGISGRLAQYLALGQEAKAVTKRQAEIKSDLLSFVEQDGNHEIDEEKGHLLHTLPEPVVIGTTAYTGFMKQRRVGQSFLEDEARALCEAKGFDLDDYTTRYVDQDKIVRLYAEDKISDEEFRSLTEETITWAFTAVKS